MAATTWRLGGSVWRAQPTGEKPDPATWARVRRDRSSVALCLICDEGGSMKGIAQVEFVPCSFKLNNTMQFEDR